MKNWERYREYLETGDFHVHTDYTEGSHNILELCEQAIMNNLKLIAFTEHVRKVIFYDFDAFLADIDSARQRYPKLRILSGCEASVTDTEGSLDVSQGVLENIDIVVASFHSFPYGHKAEFLSALYSALKNPRVDIWGHPATFLRNVNLTVTETMDIINACKSNSVLIEDSLAPVYRTHPEFIKLANELGALTVRNSDAHCRENLKKV